MNTENQNMVNVAPDAIWWLNSVGAALISGCSVASMVGPSSFGEEQFYDSIHPYWMFPVCCLPFLVIAVLIMKRFYWKVDDRAVYRGGKEMFLLNEIEAVQVGLPDNWLQSLGSILKPSQAAAHEEIQRIGLVIKLSKNRWMIWVNRNAQNRERFVERIVGSAETKGVIGDIPEKVLKHLKSENSGRVLQF